ncbi:MAG: HD domain-containing protein [Nitrospiraceae bacterium]|nr:HD domain-containing protein [Nitrospiraceae bacterium]
MIRKALLLKIFGAAYMQRWNDKVRPVELVELDKQAHKMIVAYFLGKFEETAEGFDWVGVIEGGLFELLQRLVITDLKPPIFYKIKSDRVKYGKLNDWVFKEIQPVISPLGAQFSERFRDYFASTDETPARSVLNAAHFYATKWEFAILERANPGGYEIGSIKESLDRKQEEYAGLKGMASLRENGRYRSFLDLCGQLRFQTRWSNLHRVPKTSVIGHSLFVALLSYLFSIQVGACRRRSINNYFTGLFHDLPEVLTRDIISPVKKSVEGLDELIKEYEKEQMDKEVYGLIPREWHADIRMFTEEEFTSIVHVNGRRKKVSSAEISGKYNEDGFNPRDGELVKAADSLAAFIEADVAIKNGSYSPEFQEAKMAFRNIYGRANIAGINFGEIYADFD